jgi:hypothetical protein
MLDEAIREHLELKRTRGAAPAHADLEAEQALEPVFPEETKTVESPDGDQAPEGEEAPDAHAAPAAEDVSVPATPPLEGQLAIEEPATAPTEPQGVEPEPRALDLSTIGQETAEIDMGALLAEEHDEHPSP